MFKRLEKDSIFNSTGDKIIIDEGSLVFGVIWNRI